MCAHTYHTHMQTYVHVHTCVQVFTHSAHMPMGGTLGTPTYDTHTEHPSFVQSKHP